MMTARPFRLPTTLAFLLITSMTAGDLLASSCDAVPRCRTKRPDGYDAYMVFMANGEVSIDDPLTLITDEFFTDVMGWGEAELEAFRQEKRAIFAERFGIEDPENDPNLLVVTGMTNPALDYRAYTISGRSVPRSGWAVREGVYSLIVLDPEGRTLGGEFEGVHVPFNTIIGSGIYNVEVTDRFGEPTGEEIVITFDAGQPIILDGEFGRLSFFCDVESDTFGSGRAQGISDPDLIGEGLLKSNVRNVLTFSSDGGL